MIASFDDQFQRLLDTLDELSVSDDTIVVFTSDHGDMHGSQGVYKKQWPWNEAIKVPFVIRYPGVVPQGAKIESPLNVIDVMPTLLGLAGLPVELSKWAVQSIRLPLGRRSGVAKR